MKKVAVLFLVVVFCASCRENQQLAVKESLSAAAQDFIISGILNRMVRSI